ncbi:hypothetical protein K8I31_09970, partial [bacterium]|nr:hypothetical protein [bacterium]
KTIKQSPHIREVAFEGKRVFPLKENGARSGIDFSAINNNQGILFSSKNAGTFECRMNDGKSKTFAIRESKILKVEGEWTVSFPYGWGAPQRAVFGALQSWTEFPDAGVQAFSGIATYRKTILLDLDDFSAYQKIVLDLGEVREVARAYWNGHDLGVSSFAPHQYDVTNAVRNGENYLVIEVANNWANRVIADAKLPLEQRLTHTNLTNGPDNKPWAKSEPLPSGLLGPVVIKGENVVHIKR